MESAVIVNIAHKLVHELATRDPLAERVKLTKWQYGACALRGMVSGYFA